MGKMEYYELTFENLMKDRGTVDRDVCVDALLYQLEMDQEIEKNDPLVIAWYQKVSAAKSL